MKVDNWTGDPLINDIDIGQLINKGINSHIRIAELSTNGCWNIPADWFAWFLFLNPLIAHLPPPDDSADDYLGWNCNTTSLLVLKDAYCFKAKSGSDCPWSKEIWHSNTP
ncbi:unnamed protein product [Vicia faba]|uniref:Uncharacterized protein n=1 Tax=Vicia faba TaxID=3906 RepID=A0AAV0ZSS6_VICFA|nr:unnamed protein product [Vicia faba]